MMRHLDHSQIRILTQVHEFKIRCAANGLQIDQGQAYECLLLASDPERQAMACRFHNENTRCNHSCGEIHFSDDQDDFFDLAAPEKEEEPEDAEEKLREIMVMCPCHLREKITRVLMEMKRVDGSESIRSAAQAVGIPRATFYKIIHKAHRWITRPPTPDGWSGIDCSLLLQMSLDFGRAE